MTLPHTGLKVERWRYHLIGYEDVEIIQFIEFGFPLGLSPLPELECSNRNHGSAYMWYDHVDKFVCTEVTEGGLAGPFKKAPWWNSIISPLMTAHKKVMDRRTVFDATYGEKSLNNSTPSDNFMGMPCKYTFPKIQDYKEMILTCGPGAWMYKHDLARFFLQIPLARPNRVSPGRECVERLVLLLPWTSFWIATFRVTGTEVDRLCVMDSAQNGSRYQ